MEPQVPPHVVKEPPMPVSSASMSPNIEDSTHSPLLNDSSPPENDVSKTAPVKQTKMEPELKRNATLNCTKDEPKNLLD